MICISWRQLQKSGLQQNISGRKDTSKIEDDFKRNNILSHYSGMKKWKRLLVCLLQHFPGRVRCVIFKWILAGLFILLFALTSLVLSDHMNRFAFIKLTKSFILNAIQLLMVTEPLGPGWALFQNKTLSMISIYTSDLLQWWFSLNEVNYFYLLLFCCCCCCGYSLDFAFWWLTTAVNCKVSKICPYASWPHCSSYS